MTLSRLTAALADRYRIEREIGAGGMATVYLAHDIKHERAVAIKVLREDLSASLGSGRFLREIKIAAQLQHPHILPLLDSGEADGFLYFVMPYIKGQSLRERIARDGELPVHEAVRLLTEVVDALVEAHAHGVVHRDIKPDNVMLSGRHALVTDFGVAKAISEATGRNTVTTLGVAVGTPTYMSPEQAAADPHVDHRSDIYSVGVMAFEMLAGKPPFTGSSPQQVLAAHVTEAPDSVAKRRPSIPPALEQIVMRCLAKRPADRFQTAAELHAALEPLATPSTGITPTQTRPIEALTTADPRSVTRRTAWLVGAAALVAMAAFLGFRSRRSSASPVPSAITTQATTSGDVLDPTISPDGTRIAYTVIRCDSAGYCLHDVLVRDLGGAGTLTVLSGATSVYGHSWSSDSRYLSVNGSFGQQWGQYTVPATVQGPPTFRGCCGGSFLVSADTLLHALYSPSTDTSGLFQVITASDGRVRDSVRYQVDHFGVTDWSVSPDGKTIAMAVPRAGIEGRVRLIDRHGRMTDSMGVASLSGIWWIPDGSAVLYTAAVRGVLDRFNVVLRRVDHSGRFTGPSDTLMHDHAMLGGGIALTRDGSTLSYNAGTRTSRVYMLGRTDLSSTKFSQRIISSSTASLRGSLSPDGSRILLGRLLPGAPGHSRQQLSFIAADSGAESIVTPVLDTLPGAGWALTGSGSVIYSVPQGKATDQVLRADLQTGRATPLFTLPDSTGDLRLIEVAGGRILTIHPSSREYTLISPTGQQERRISLPVGLYSPGIVARSPDGSEIAVVGYDNSTEDSVVVYRTRISDGVSRQVAAIPMEAGAGLAWLDNGDILVVLGETRQNFSLYRIPPGGGLKKIGVVPFGSGAAYEFSRDGLRMLVNISEPHGDVWLVKNFGKMWQR